MKQNTTQYKVESVKFIKLSIIALCLGVIGFSATFAQTTGTTATSLTTQLEAARNISISTLDTQAAQFREQHFSQSQTIETNPNYQSLVCLGILDQVQPSKSFDDSIKSLRNEILQQYITLDGKIKSIALDLDVDQVKLQSDIESFANTYNTRITQLINSYNQQLTTLQSNVAAYTNANQSLLSSLNARVTQLNSIMAQYEALEDLIFQFNNTLLVQEGNLLDAISEQKRQAMALLDERLATLIQQQLRRSTHMLGLEPILQSRRRDVVRLYGLDFDDAMADVVGNRYSRQAHDTLREQMQTIRNTFYVGNNLRCQNILTAGMDVDGYARVVSANINDMQRRLTMGITTLQATGSAEQLKQSMFRTFQGLYTTRIEQEVSAMRAFTTDQVSRLLDRAARQSQELEDLQTRKTDYERSTDSATRESIITQGRNLYETAATVSIRNSIKSILESLGVDLTPPAQNVHGQVIQTDNQFLPIIIRMASRHSSPEAFATLMEVALPRLQERLETEAPSQRIVLQQVIEAIQLYIAQ